MSAPSFAGSPRFLGVADGLQKQGACCMDTGHVGRRVSPEERDDLYALVKTHLQPLILWPVQHQVDAKRSIRLRAGLTDGFSYLIGVLPADRQHP